MHPEIAQLEAFRVVAAQLHFGRAAAQLHISQSAVSHRIRALESCVGVRLIDRTRRQVRLTRAGVAYLHRVGPLLHELERARADAVEAASGHAGRLVIGYSGALTNTPLLAAVERIARELPTVRVELQRRGLHEQLAAINAGELDIGCSFLDLPTGRIGLQHWTLEPYPVFAWVGPQHPLAGEDETSLARLSEERWVVLSERAEAGIGSFFASRGARIGSPAIEVDALDAAFDIVRRGLAVSVMPDTPAAPFDVHRLSLTDALTTTVRVFWSGARVSPVLRAFLAALEPARAP